VLQDRGNYIDACGRLENDDATFSDVNRNDISEVQATRSCDANRPGNLRVVGQGVEARDNIIRFPVFPRSGEN
jgi:hypothetical protein